MAEGPVRRYKCSSCDKQFDIYATYYSHTQRHLPPKKKCQYCDHMFYSNLQLNAHQFLCMPKTPVNSPNSTHVGRSSLVPFLFRDE
jgi:DNA-directed RNA polymerase subunit RPC12/RpoP